MVDRVSPKPKLPVSALPNRAALPRRRPVPGHPGIYYRPRAHGKIAPPYEFRYLDSSGRDRWEVVHGNLDVAETRRAELRLRRRRGERIEPTRQTFEQYASEWLERQTVRPRTLEIYSWALTQHLLPHFGQRRLDQITAEDVAAFIAQMRRKKLKGWTITSALRPLSIMLAQAVRKGRIPINPISQLERGSCGFPFEPGAVSRGEDEGVWVEAVAAFGDEREQPAHQLGRDVDGSSRLFGFEEGAAAVAAELIFNADQCVL